MRRLPGVPKQTPGNLLAAIKTADGSGSGLDADLVRGTTPGTGGLAVLDDASVAAVRSTLGVVTTATSAWNLVASSVNESVASAAASSNLDVAVAASTTSHYTIYVEAEGSGDVDAWQVATTRARRSGTANATVSGASVKDGSGSISVSATASTTNLRVSVTNNLGVNARLNIYVFELVSGASAEFS